MRRWSLDIRTLDVIMPFFFFSKFPLERGKLGFLFAFLMGVLHSTQNCYLLNLAGIIGEGSYGLKENKLFAKQWKPCRSIALGAILVLPLQVEKVYRDALILMDQCEVF